MLSGLSCYIALAVIGLVMALTYRHFMIKIMTRWHKKMMNHREEAKKEVEHLNRQLEIAIEKKDIITGTWLYAEIKRIKNAWQLE